MKTTHIDDPTIAAAIVTLNTHLQAIPFKTGNGRVAFEIDTDDLSEEYQRLYSGEAAPLRDYIRNLKELRASIFSLKNSR